MTIVVQSGVLRSKVFSIAPASRDLLLSTTVPLLGKGLFIPAHDLVISPTVPSLSIGGSRNLSPAAHDLAISQTAPGASVSSGFNNLTTRPRTSGFRPTGSGTTLSFIGPSGGGVSTANDVQRNITLTNFVGDKTLGASATLTNTKVNGSVVITGNNVTIKGCWITGQNAGALIDADGFTGVTLEDCDIDGQGVDTRDLFLGSGTIRRCRLHGAENGLNLQGSSTVVDSYVHGLFRTANPDPHIDGVQIQSGSNYTISHNDIYGWDTSALQFQCKFSSIGGTTSVDDNNFLMEPGEGSFYIILYDTGGTANQISGVTFSNNVFEKGTNAWVNTDGIANAPTWGSGNTDFATGNPITSWTMAVTGS